MIDQLRQLAIFAKTIDHGSFRGAARELKLSPSVVSHHISQLEDYLGTALIYRTTRKLSLTPEGARLLSAAHNMLDAVESEMLDISGSANDPSGEIRITMPSVLAQSELTTAIAAFLIEYPRITLYLDYSDTQKQLIDDGFDIAIRMWRNAKISSTTKTLFSVNRKLVAAKDLKLNIKDYKNPMDLINKNWLMLSPVHNQGISFKNKNNKELKIKPNARLFSNEARSIYNLVQSGAGIAALPEFLTAQGIKEGKIKQLIPEWTLDPLYVFAEWPVNAPKNGLINLFVKFFSAYKFDI